MEEKLYYSYILASKPYGTLYNVVTSDLLGRVWEHKNDCVEGFTKRYGVHMLVFMNNVEVLKGLLQEKSR